jgi:hypothetical protein
MKRRTLLVILIYGGFALFALAVAVSNPRLYAVDAHLTLLATGIPLSLLSLYFPHGSVLGMVAAAGLGLIQWICVFSADAWMEARADKRNPS